MIDRRALGAELFSWLASAPGRSVLEAMVAERLDIRFREEAIVAHEGHTTVAKIVWRTKQQRPRLEISSGSMSISEFIKELPEIARTLRDRNRSVESKWEADIVRTNDGVLDRRMSIGRRRIDLLAVVDGELVAVEIKRELDARIALVPKYLAQYLERLDPQQKGLRTEAAIDLIALAEQRAKLGLAGPEPRSIHENMRMHGLIALARHKSGSPLVGRARKAAAREKRPIWFCTIDDANPRFPPRSAWFR